MSNPATFAVYAVNQTEEESGYNLVPSDPAGRNSNKPVKVPKSV